MTHRKARQREYGIKLLTDAAAVAKAYLADPGSSFVKTEDAQMEEEPLHSTPQ